MKKIIVLTFLGLCLLGTLEADAQIKLGLKGGMSFSSASLSDGWSNIKSDNFVGFFIGPMLDCTIPFIGIGVDASVLFAQRGAKLSSNGYTETIKQNGIDIPVNLKYNFGLGSLIGLYVALGPDFYFDFDKYDDVDKRESEVGMNIGAGLKMLSHWQLGFNYNFPLRNTARMDENTYKTKSWQIVLAYMF